MTFKKDDGKGKKLEKGFVEKFVDKAKLTAALAAMSLREPKFGDFGKPSPIIEPINPDRFDENNDFRIKERAPELIPLLKSKEPPQIIDSFLRHRLLENNLKNKIPEPRSGFTLPRAASTDEPRFRTANLSDESGLSPETLRILDKYTRDKQARAASVSDARRFTADPKDSDPFSLKTRAIDYSTFLHDAPEDGPRAAVFDPNRPNAVDPFANKNWRTPELKLNKIDFSLPDLERDIDAYMQNMNPTFDYGAKPPRAVEATVDVFLAITPEFTAIGVAVEVLEINDPFPMQRPRDLFTPQEIRYLVEEIKQLDLTKPRVKEILEEVLTHPALRDYPEIESAIREKLAEDANKK